MHTLQLILSPLEASSDISLKQRVARESNISLKDISEVRLIKRSLDCRQRDIKVLLTLQVFTNDEDRTLRYEEPIFRDVSNSNRQIVIVGAGPAGLFAALRCLELGIRPIVIERGKEVSSRKRDIALLNRNEGLNAESNYCFGEGGAGTFSDGKLFSRSKKRGEMQRVMELFHHFGANDSVLYETHAHIGSDRLPEIIKSIRRTIIEYGGEIHFETKMTGLLRNAGKVCGIRTEGGQDYMGDAVVLAIGHSAHDTYRLLEAEGVELAAKGFAMGVRVEHSQRLINQLIYRRSGRELEQMVEWLGNANYSLVTQVEGRGVYSFCMCPGGHIVPAGSIDGSCVVNGMSSSLRNSPFANSGIVVEIRPEDVNGKTLQFQEDLERLAYENGGGKSIAPAQRLRDFVEGRLSDSLPACSYLPGIVSSKLSDWLPKHIGRRLQQGFQDFDKKYRGYLTNDAVVLGVESRSSSAVRISRDRETMESVNTPCLYPCGEGAGYAGGITSSALDGINIINKIYE